MINPFNPDRGTNINVTVTAVSQSTVISAKSVELRFVNSGLNICYVRIGAGTQVATTSDFPIRPGESVRVFKGSNEGTVAYISPSGTNLSFQTSGGEGAGLTAPDLTNDMLLENGSFILLETGDNILLE